MTKSACLAEALCEVGVWQNGFQFGQNVFKARPIWRDRTRARQKRIPPTSMERRPSRRSPMHRHRARNPRKSPLWQCAHRHFVTFGQIYPQDYQPRLGPLRPVIPQVVHKFPDCGNLDRGFARLRCDHCQHEYLLAFSCKSRWFCPTRHWKISEHRRLYKTGAGWLNQSVPK